VAGVEAWTDLAAAAARVIASLEGQHAAVAVLGTPALLRYRLDRQEDDRRRRAGLRAIRSPEVVELLLGLPVGAAVPVASLTPSERSALRSVPRGVVAVAAGSVTRQAVQPLAVDLAVVAAARGWRGGLQAAGRFAPFCSRVLLLRQPPTDVADLRLQADFYGIGVAVATSADQVEVMVAPRPFRRLRFTAAGWLFLEEVYQHLR
jgi:hypothetical protein